MNGYEIRIYYFSVFTGERSLVKTRRTRYKWWAKFLKLMYDGSSATIVGSLHAEIHPTIYV